VYDDGRMIRYTGADVYTSDVEDTQAKEWGLAWELELGDCFTIFYLWFWILEIVMSSPITVYKFWRDV